jgi:membrane protein
MNADETGQLGAGQGPKWKNWLRKVAVVRPLWALYRGYKLRSGPLLSAGIAYYLLFSLAPVTFLTLRVAGHFIDTATMPAEHLKATLGTYVGPVLASLFTRVITEYGTSGWGTATTIVGSAMLLYGATRLVVRLQVAFNLMWDIRVRPRGFSYRKLLSRLLLFSLLLIPSAVLVLSVALQSGIPLLHDLLGQGIFVHVFQGVMAFLITWAMLILVFAILPDIRVSVSDCWQGALLTAMLCAIGTGAFGAYMIWSGGPKHVGLVGVVLVVIVWADFMAIIVLLGVRLNRVLYQISGKTLQPYEYAVILEDPVGLGADELNPEEWARLYSGASGVVEKGLARAARKTNADTTSEPPRDGSDGVG